MTERYAYLAPDHLHQVVAKHRFLAQFEHSENTLTAVASKMCAWLLVLRISPAKAILVPEQGQTPNSLKRSYENAPLGQKRLKYVDSWAPENGLFLPFLLLVWLGGFRKSVSSLRISRGI